MMALTAATGFVTAGQQAVAYAATGMGFWVLASTMTGKTARTGVAFMGALLIAGAMELYFDCNSVPWWTYWTTLCYWQ